MKKLISRLLIIPTVFFTTLPLSASKKDSLDEWSKAARPRILDYLFDNISRPDTVKGVVVASPSKYDPNYYYHWIRDAALVMDVVVSEHASAVDPILKQQYFQRLMDFVEFSGSNQKAWTPSGGPGEPKFNVDGTAYSEPWGRPQNDGPALRAITLIKFSNTLLKEGQQDLVRQKLYDGTNSSVIKSDLEYISHRWRDLCFDLWEETYGQHFYTLIVTRRALKDGAAFAYRLDDNLAGDWYLRQMRAIEDVIEKHWSEKQKAYVATVNPTYTTDPLFGYARSGYDASVILGILHGETGDGYLDVTHERVQSTVERLEREFKRIYVINNMGHRGIAIGRYPEDRYTGHNIEGEGNPWFLTTLGFTEFYYKLASALQEMGKIEITPYNYNFYKNIGIMIPAKKTKMGTIRKSDQPSEFRTALLRVREKGDDFLAVTQFHMGADLRMSEQFNRYTGFMQGANDLTWSYASFITALNQTPLIRGD